MRLSIFLMISLLLAKNASAIGLKYQGKGFGGYTNTSMSVTSESRANYGGPRYGGEAAIIADAGTYGGAGFVGYRTGDSDNSANNTTSSETINSKMTYGGGRAYAADAFFQIAVVYQESKISYTTGSTTTQALYSGFGYHLGLGIDIPLGASLFISPVAYYEKADLTQKDASVGSRRVEEGGVLLGAGFTF
jgi:hypothetical protein